MRLTTEIIMTTRPCSSWNRERIEALISPRKYVLHSTALRDMRVPIGDRIWLGITLLDDPRRRLFACDCAERALSRERDAGREPDPRSWAAVEIARRYARGEATNLELTTALSAAAAASASAAAAAAAHTAAYSTAAAAARAAAAAARAAAAAMEAAWGATIDAAMDAERRWQAKRLITYLDGAIL